MSSEVGEGFADGEASPDRLRLVLTLPGTPADEVRLHLACAEHRLRGEWYDVAAVDLEATMDADLDLLCISLYCAADASLLVVKLGPLLVAVALLGGCGGDGQDTVTVPDVRGLELEAAQGELLEAGVVHEDVNCELPAVHAIVEQHPAPGTQVEPGTRVALLLEQQHGSGVAPPVGGWPRCETASFR